jgi:hypothetical protein
VQFACWGSLRAGAVCLLGSMLARSMLAGQALNSVP